MARLRFAVLLFGLWAAGAGAQSADDARQLVSMPPQAQAILRMEMLDNLSALNEVIGLLGENQLAAAGEAAEKGLGYGAMGKHAPMARGMGPGRFMPEAMHGIGIAMHGAASEFAKAAKAGDGAKAYAQLQQVTGACVACHASYRTR